MTLRGIPQSLPIAQQNAANGTPALLNLTLLLSGNSQNSLILPTDAVLISTADGTNKGVTLPDPNKYGGTLMDTWLVVNGQSGQTINVYPPTGGNIDGAGLNTAATLAQGTTITFYLQSFTATTSVWVADGGS